VSVAAVQDYGLPVLYALLVWWASTGAIMYLDGLPRRTFPWTLAGATALLAAALWAAFAARGEASVPGAFVGFTAGLMVFGWVQVTFYTGLVTGPRRHACPSGCSGWRHFRHGVEATLHHELLLIAAGALLVALTWGSPNQVATWTYMVLWWMHQSAKLNVFLGVRNLNEEFLPDHLRYLTAFFRTAPMNPLFPVSVTVSTVATVLIALAALAPDATPFERAGSTFLALLMALAVLEHWFLVLPLPAMALWKWSLASRRAEPPVPYGPLQSVPGRTP